MRLKNLIVWDFKFQYKYGILFAAVMMAIVWTGIIYLLPTSTMVIAFPIMFVTDFAVAGFLLVAAMVFFEKGQNSLQALVVTPVRVLEYIVSKVISLSIMLSIIAFVLALVVMFSKNIEINLVVAIFSAFVSCSFFVFLGLIVSTFYQTFTDLILPMGVLFSVCFIPFLTYVNSESLDFLDYFIWIFPTFSMLKLVDFVFLDFDITPFIVCTLYILMLDFVLFKILIRLFNQKIIGRSK